MPELPEVETTRLGILPYIEDQTIQEVILRHHSLRWPIPENIQATLVGEKVEAVTRRGKYLLLHFQAGTLLIHLGMSGHLRLLADLKPALQHDHIDIIFANHRVLRFNDPRRFGAFLWLVGDPYQHVLLKHLGVEPLSRHFTARYLWQRARKKKLAIKSFLMDGKIVTGIGNIYATEALFAAKINPTRSAHSLTLKNYADLVKACKRILTAAIKRGGTTLKDFMTSEGKPGYFAQHLKVYGRGGLPCKRCGKKLITLRQGQRSTVYCKFCQKQGACVSRPI